MVVRLVFEGEEAADLRLSRLLGVALLVDYDLCLDLEERLSQLQALDSVHSVDICDSLVECVYVVQLGILLSADDIRLQGQARQIIVVDSQLARSFNNQLDVLIRPEVVLHLVIYTLLVEPLGFEGVESRELVVVVDLNCVMRLVEECESDKAGPVLGDIERTGRHEL